MSSLLVLQYPSILIVYFSRLTMVSKSERLGVPKLEMNLKQWRVAKSLFPPEAPGHLCLYCGDFILDSANFFIFSNTAQRTPKTYKSTSKIDAV
jgi:hypothetical protein